jgi:hypothetical protein
MRSLPVHRKGWRARLLPFRKPFLGMREWAGIPRKRNLLQALDSPWEREEGTPIGMPSSNGDPPARRGRQLYSCTQLRSLSGVGTAEPWSARLIAQEE